MHLAKIIVPKRTEDFENLHRIVVSIIKNKMYIDM